MTEVTDRIDDARPRQFRRYAAYKDSGVEWMGEIPAHWEVRRLKFLTYTVAGQSPPSIAVSDGMDGLPFLQGNAEFGPLNPTPHQVCDSAPKRAEPGDILLSVRAPVGAMNIADQPYGIGRGLCAIRPALGIDRSFCFYEIMAVRPLLDAVATGSTYDAVTASNVGDLPMLLPYQGEQRAIAAFLDRETARIDGLVVRKERLMELLQEKRAALLTRAVTRGLDPNVSMKDSGVEWLGEIPAHWDMKKIKRFCLVRRGASPRPIDDPAYFDDEGEYAWVRIADVTASEKYLETTTQRLSESGKSKSVSLEPGELFLSIAATVGKPIIARIKCCIHDGFVYFVGLHENREYLYYLFSCGEAYKGLGKLGTQLNLNTDTVGDIYVPLPQPAEQRAIVQFLDRETTSIDALIAKIRQAIDHLKEFRTAFISAAVTGKIDVREDAS